MISIYTAYNPPTQVGMKMVKGPRFFEAFGGGWQFKPLDDSTTEAVWRYTFTIRPRWLAVVADPIGRWLLGRDIEARIRAFASACGDLELVAEALAQTGLDPSSP
jgi:ribosome-associated toxin RatA of RatAB toxin-antitoxin module